jgi:hypothetical protein
MKRERVRQIARAMVKRFGLINLSRSDLCIQAGIPDGSFKNVMGCTFTEFVEELREENGSNGRAHVVTKSRVNAKDRKKQILTAAVDLAQAEGFHHITREGVAAAAGVSEGLVSKHFGTMAALRRAVMRAAINQEILEIVAQGLSIGDPCAIKAPDALKADAARSLL